MKKANFVLVYKKLTKNDVRNYRPISLLPIFSNVFEKLIFNAIYSYLYLQTNDLLSRKKFGFRPGNHVSAVIENFNAFYCNPSLEVQAVLIDISKAFD